MDAKTLAKEVSPTLLACEPATKTFSSCRDYVELLSWTASSRIQELYDDEPDSLKAVLSQVGIEASMWRDLVWDF